MLKGTFLELERVGTGKGGFPIRLLDPMLPILGLRDRICAAVPFEIIADRRMLGWRESEFRRGFEILDDVSNEVRLDILLLELVESSEGREAEVERSSFSSGTGVGGLL